MAPPGFQCNEKKPKVPIIFNSSTPMFMKNEQSLFCGIFISITMSTITMSTIISITNSTIIIITIIMEQLSSFLLQSSKSKKQANVCQEEGGEIEIYISMRAWKS